MSLLTIVQGAATQIGVTRPNNVVSSTDNTVKELYQFANVEGRFLCRSSTWQQLVDEHTFDTVADTEAYDLPSDFLFLINNTIWNRTNNWPVRGVLTPQQWQADKSDIAATPYDSYRIRGNQILLYPTPSAAESIYFEYMSENWAQDSGGTAKSSFTADTDTGRLDEYLIELGVIWRWKKSKGFDYSEDYRTYQTEVSRATGRDGGSPVVSMNARRFVLTEGRTPDGDFPSS